MNNRVTALRDRVLSSRRIGDPRAQVLRSECQAQTEGEPAVIREAKALAHYYRHQDVTIHDGELVVGCAPGLVRDPAGPIQPAIFGRRTFAAPSGPGWPVPDTAAAYWQEGMLAPAGNHTTLDYESIFAEGFDGLFGRIDARLAQLTPDESGGQQKREFLTALRLVAEGYLELSNRYAKSAQALARKTTDPARKRELQTIARNCRRVPAKVPVTFWEACQCAWFSFFLLPDAPGRVDQYLYPCYRRDVAAGTLTREFAKELLSCLWLKYFEAVGAASGVSAHTHLTLGGVKPDGSDAANEVTYLCLEITEELKLNRPQVGLRCNRNTPLPLLRQAVQALRSRTSSPDFCNDEVIVPALTRIGVRVEDARDFSLSGCHEVIVTGRAQMGSVEGFVNMPKILGMVLGLEPALEPVTDLAAIATADELWQRLEQSMDRVAEAAHLSSLGRDRAAADQPGGQLAPSLVVRDCIENCRGYTQGGARYNFCNWDVIGLANLADALVALNVLVFEKKEVTLAEFARILRGDWQGHETLRRRVLREAPHFGNDNPAADQMAARIIDRFSAILARHQPFRGGHYILGTTAGGENMHIEFGRVTGATADGRKAGEPLADSVGAAQGRDVRGVTALLNSVASLPHRLLPTATTLNVKLDPRLIETATGIDKIAALIRSHFASGGQQMQFNLVNRAMLFAAKAHPENYADLMVRVAGYSAPFIALWGDLQDEIIARTGHEA